MSAEKCYIQKLEVGEILALFSPSMGTVECEIEKQEVSSSVDECTGNSNPAGQEFANKSSNDCLDSVPEDKEIDDAPENDSDCSNENLKFGEPSSFSTPAIIQTIVSDDIPLLRNTSSATHFCSCLLGVDRDNDSTSDASCGCSYHDDIERNNISMVKTQTRESLMIPGLIQVPIVGHETMEARSKFTVFKIHVMVEEGDAGWFIFRRYSDFVHLNDQLRMLYPSFRFILPPKRWFKSNFDSDFLEERRQGLQTYLDNVTGHRDICNCKPVRDFFCFDDPPGPHDSLEESRAQCECMEEMLYLLRKELTEKDTEVELLKEELDLYKNQVHLLSGRLSELNRLGSMQKPGSEKHEGQPADGQFGIDALFGSGDILLTNKLDFITELKTPEVKE